MAADLSDFWIFFVVFAFWPTVIERKLHGLDATAFGQFDLGSFDGLLGLVALVSCQNKMGLGVVACGGGDAP